MNNPRYSAKRMTAHYAVTFGVFFAAFCMIRSFISVYLLDRGFTYTQVGIITGIHMFVTAVVQPNFSRVLDRFPKLGLRRFMALCCIPGVACSLLTFVLPSRMWLFILLYILFGVFEVGMQSLMVSLGMEYVNAGVGLDPGFGRGFGSVGYALANIFLGMLIVRYGSPVSHFLNIGLMVLLGILLATMPDSSLFSQHSEKQETGSAEVSDGFADFLKTHPSYALFAASVVCLFFGHSIVNTYMPNVVGQFGLGSDFAGLANGLAAFLELIPMMLSVRLSKRISAAAALRFSIVFFLVKILLTTLAQNGGQVLAAHSLQILAYGVFCMFSVYFTNEAVLPRNRVMAQGLIVGANEAGFTIGSLVSGVVLDHYDIRVLLWIGVAVSALGVVMALYALRPSALYPGKSETGKP